ncbi:MAG: ThuA domain-containing protein [Cellulophaga sp.]
MKRYILLVYCLVLIIPISYAQNIKPLDLSNDWISKIEAIAPSKPRIAVTQKKKILLFSLHTGYKHWVIPHTEKVLEIIAKKSDAFSITVSYDINDFSKKSLKQFDAIILNNTCSIGTTRNLFWEAIKEDPSLSGIEKLKKASKLESNLYKFVKKGKGLMVLHGAITMQNKSTTYGEMVGGTFDYHPKQQNIHIKLVDPKHPLVQAFDANGFEHIDEPYFFSNAYFDYNFRPLLYMEANTLEGLKEEVTDSIKYVSWIKKYGKGRVFYSSPSHNAQSFENPQLLQFFLDGIQYIVGDLECDDSPIGK